MKAWHALSGFLLIAAIAHAQSATPPPGTTTDDDAPAKVVLPSGHVSAEPEPVTEAESKIEARDFAGARALLDPYLAAHPNDARALFDRGYVEDAQGNSDSSANSATAFYRHAIAADPKQFEARLALGLDLAAAGKTDEAREQIDAATKLTPEPPNPAAQGQAFRALARVLQPSDPNAARAALLAALKLTPETPSDTLLTAEIAAAAGDDDVAREAYGRVLASDAANPQATAGLAHLLIRDKNYAEAEPLLRKALGTTPEDAALNAQLAAVLSGEGKQAEAVEALEKVHAGAPADLHITAMLADLYTQAGDAAKADPLYVQLLAAAPGDPSLLAARGNNLIRQQRYPEAIPVLQQATRLDPANGDAWSGLAFAASKTHQPQLTLDALAMRSKVMSDTPSTYFLSATAYDTLHQTKFAVEKYKQFLATAGGRFPDQEWQAKHRLVALEK
jgi:Flp pilus assembly protein TadD